MSSPDNAAATPTIASKPPLDRHPPYRVYFWLLACGWTLAVAGSMAWNSVARHEKVQALALETGRALFEKDLIYRQWAARQGGVYVPATQETPPNPHLKVPERDIVTPSGKALTLVNPAYMTRQVFDLQKQQLGAQGHITSLKPIRPENAPDDWERQALRGFEQGHRETSGVEQIDGQPYLRLMRPLVADAACLQCHAAQGYKVGDIRGGISVSVPMRQFEVAASLRELALAHGALWLLGLAGLVGGSHHLQRQIRARNSVEDHLRQLSRAVEQNPASIVITDPHGNIEYVNPKFCQVTGYAAEEAREQNPRILKSGETSSESYRQLWESIASGREWRGEFHNKRKDGQLYWERASISPILDGNGRITHFVAVKEDVTAQKTAEAERERLIQELRAALADVRTLSGIIPICAGCKKIRDDKGYWEQVEGYIQRHSLARFSHGLCPDCLEKYYPGAAARLASLEPPGSSPPTPPAKPGA